MARKDEVQTRSIILEALERGAKVLVPITPRGGGGLVFSELKSFSELAVGAFGILEPKPGFVRPAPLSGAEAVLVPLVAWDERGFRIGHGRGYFDKALAHLVGPVTIGLAFEAQRVARVPDQPYDVPLMMMVTERRVLEFEGSRRSP